MELSKQDCYTIAKVANKGINIPNYNNLKRQIFTRCFFDSKKEYEEYLKKEEEDWQNFINEPSRKGLVF